MRKWQGYKYVVGVDEVGRGPVAGPVAVGVAMVRPKSRHIEKVTKLLRGIKDSKQLSESSREGWFGRLNDARRLGILDYAVSFVGQKIIDDKGISFAISLATKRSLSKLGANPRNTLVLLDGGLRADEVWRDQTTIVRGDEKESLIAVASIVAKVLRDRKMVGYSKLYPKYGFEKHKGYGTKLHMSAINRYGKSRLHRKTFLKRNLGRKKSKTRKTTKRR